MAKKRHQISLIVRAYLEQLKKLGITVERTIVYGSFARGDNKEESDIDLVVVSKDFEKMNLRERLEILGVAAARILEPIEALGYTPREIEKAEKGGFLNEVLNSKVVNF